MVAPGTLVLDISSVAVSVAVPGIAWALLFGVAWRHPRFAESVGLGPREFWLLLPGAILASFALLPIAPISNDVLAVSFAGAVFPLGVATLALARVAGPSPHGTTRLLGGLAVETALLLAVVVLAGAGRLSGVAGALGVTAWNLELVLVVGLAAVATVVVVALVGRAAQTRVLGGAFALTNAALVLTFLGARAIPGVGITEGFPYFLLPPVLVGVVAVLLAPRFFPRAEALALPVSFFAAGWGVALGADVLWQPPLYGTGPSGLYAVGGAGVLDLVYLSGFLGLLGAWGTHRLLGRDLVPVGAGSVAPSPSPSHQLREAYRLALYDTPAASLGASAAAARNSALQAHRLRGTSPADASRPWNGLGVPGWVVSDQANLDNLARAGASDPRESWRAYVTARELVGLGELLGRPRFASIGQRLLAFALDAAVLGIGGGAVFVAIVLATPGGLTGALGSVALNAAIYGFVAVALVYFAVAELWSGATVGKAIVGIEVRDRSLGRIDPVASLVRNAPLLPVMTLYSIGLGLSIAIGVDGLPANASLAGIGISTGALAIASLALFVLAGVGLAGAVGLAAIAVTSERQRVGDLWAGTWVVRRVSGPRGPASSSAAVGRSG